MPEPELAPDDRPILTISDLNRQVRSLIEGTPDLQDVWVRGEISNYTGPYRGSGHCYFRLKDEDAAVDVVMWRGSFVKLEFSPEDGMEVMARGDTGLYEARGAYQFVIREMLPAGEGELALQFQLLKKKLGEEGLFDAARKQDLPRFARHIGVVTSREAAAFRDVLNVLSRRSPHVSALLADCRVQGDGAAETVARSIQLLNDHAEDHPLDVILVVRGGGSMEDLWAFNEEPAVRAVAASRVPVISGVGHETDWTLVDMAADMRAPTPSAAAELAAPSREETLSLIEETRRNLAGRLQGLVRLKEHRLEALATRPVLTRPEALFAQAWQRTDDLGARLPRAVRRRVERVSDRLDALETRAPRAVRHRLERAGSLLSQHAGRLDALSPLKVLERGYAAVEASGGRVLSISDVARGDRLDVRVQDGTILADVVETEEENP